MTASSSLSTGVALYLEAGLRNPIISRWPPMARFLHKHINALARLASPTVSKVCEVWLASTPTRLADGATTPFRREFAEIALAIARTVQVQKGSGILYLRDGWEPIYSAALAGAGDVPEITDWVLEQTHRRKPSKSVSNRIASANAEKAAAKTKRLQDDPESAAADKERAEARRNFPRSIVTSRRLPPWPLGPKDRIDHDFHKAAIVPAGLAPLMRAHPERAAEALLALMIEGRPEERYSDYSHRDDLGLSHEHSSYPTSFWKSPFFQFLQINPAAALSALCQLVNFATERWASQYIRRGIEVPTVRSVGRHQPTHQLPPAGGYIGGRIRIRLLEFQTRESPANHARKAGRVLETAGASAVLWRVPLPGRDEIAGTAGSSGRSL